MLSIWCPMRLLYLDRHFPFQLFGEILFYDKKNYCMYFWPELFLLLQYLIFVVFSCFSCEDIDIIQQILCHSVKLWETEQVIYLQNTRMERTLYRCLSKKLDIGKRKNKEFLEDYNPVGQITLHLKASQWAFLIPCHIWIHQGRETPRLYWA